MPPRLDQTRWFAEEVLPHDSRLKAYVRGAFPAVRDVDDVVQESLLRVWKASLGRHVACARAFLFRVGRNVALDALRHERASPIDAHAELAHIDVADERPAAADLLSHEEKCALLGEALASLPERCREIVFLHKIRGLSQRAVADKLGLSEKTVANQVARGVQRCETYLRRRGVELFEL
jgi:RNA polymerase sigma factor (sigma-70 family)